jgi:hypothetical protein
LALIGVDQQARKPTSSGRALNGCQRGSVSISSASTGSPHQAADPQEPISGPMATPSSARE